MKRIYSFMFAAVAAFAAASCAQELDNQVPAGETKVYTAAVDGAETKAVLDGRSTNWENNDVILIYDGAAAAKYVTSLEAPSSTASFSLAENETALAGNKVIAVYPEWADGYKFSVADIQKKTLSKAYLTPEQNAKVGTYDPNAAIAMAYSEDNHLEFKNATALLKFTVSTENVKAVTLYSLGFEKLTGEWAIDYNDGQPKATPAEGDASAHWVQLSAGQGVFEVGKEYYISVYPQTLASGFAVEFSFEGVNGKQLVKKYESPVEFKRNVILNIGNYEFTGTIVPEEPAAEWAIAGTFNEWNTKANPMALENGFYVAKNITGLNFTAQTDASNKTSATGFQFINKGAWKGGEGKVTAGTWAWVWNDNGQNIYVNGATAETAYDIYLNPTQDANGGIKFVVVAAGAAMPEDKPAEEIKVDYWAVVGTMTDNWNSEIKMTLEGDWYVVENVKLTNADKFKFRANGNWNDGTPNRGAEGGSEVVCISEGVDTKVVQGGKDMCVALDGIYSMHLHKNAETAKVVKTGDIVVEEPDVTTPGEDSEWALIGAFSGWADKLFVTTEDPNVVVYKSVAMKAAEGFLVRKPKTDWADKYGAGNVNYLKINHYITTSKDGADMCLESDGTYDIYFNTSTKALYVMEAGKDYSTATQQTVNGEEPKQEEPEVTEKVVYLKPNSNWTKDKARFAAYFFGGTAGEKWVSMTAVGDGIYEAHIPEGYDYGCNIIFCRMNPSTTSNNWNNKWNQTSDLKTPTDGKNLYTVKAGTWDKGGGTWSEK